MGFTGLDRFNTLEIDEFFDNFVILDYEKELLKDYYGYSDFKDLLRLSYEYYKEKIRSKMTKNPDIDMEKLKERVFDHTRTQLTMKDPSSNVRLLVSK